MIWLEVACSFGTFWHFGFTYHIEPIDNDVCYNLVFHEFEESRL